MVRAGFWQMKAGCWAALAVYLGLVIWLFTLIESSSPSASDTLMNFLPLAILLGLLYLGVHGELTKKPGR